MPTMSIYVNDRIYAYLAKLGKPSTVGKAWITHEYQRRTGDVNEVVPVPAKVERTDQENKNVQ